MIQLSPTDIKNLIALLKEVFEKYIPWAIKYYGGLGKMPSIDDLENMLKEGKEPEDYFKKKRRKRK